MTEEDRDRRLYLSPPDISESDGEAVVAAIRSGWVSSVGPEIDRFELDLAATSDRKFAVALASGTAALHLGLLALGVKAGDDVIVPTLTFGATAFAVCYTGANPVFIDVEPRSWNMDPEILESLLDDRARKKRLPAAAIPVDIFGRTCDYDALLPILNRYEIPIVVDAAESLGSKHGVRPAGSIGNAAVFSFNGNKIITTSGGGALVTDDQELARKVRHWSMQSREAFPWYEHVEIGFNYRMSNILAALGISQLRRLPQIIERRTRIRERYRGKLCQLEGVHIVEDPPWGRSNAWLTNVVFDLDIHPDAPTRVREALARLEIESRPVWKPMHQQPVFAQTESSLNGVAEKLFATGLCLPSGSAMTDVDIDQVVDVFHAVLD